MSSVHDKNLAIPGLLSTSSTRDGRPPASVSGEETVVAATTGDRVFLWTVLPVLGAASAVGLRWLAAWTAGLAWAPWQGLARTVDGLAESWGAWALGGLGVVGAGAGLLLAQHLIEDMARVVVTGRLVGWSRRGTRRRSSAARSATSSSTGSTSSCSMVRARGRWVTELPARSLRAPSRSGRGRGARRTLPFVVPTLGRRRRGAAGKCGCAPAGRAALLDGDKKADAAVVRAELVKVGVVVRDDEKRQYWRLATEDGGTGARGDDRRV
ncbi:hypothetical protein NKG05_23100 [Oerskovia sp. M15]